MPRWQQYPRQYVHWRKRTLLLLIVGTLALLAISHPIWLKLLGQALIVDEAPQPVDLIVVLGGGAGEREDWGAFLYQRDYAPWIITSGEKPHTPGQKLAFAEIASDYLADLGVPKKAIIIMPETTSTRDEAIETLAIARQRGFDSIIVITDPYHMRRSRLTFRDVFAGQDIELTFSATPFTWFRVDGWWRRERDLMAVVGEYQKMAFYLLKGWLF